jgi:hypothetical protein
VIYGKFINYVTNVRSIDIRSLKTLKVKRESKDGYHKPRKKTASVLITISDG